MRVLVAPDSFGGTLSAPEAARAMAEGWRRGSPGDELELVPLSDGGPGFVDVLAVSLGGERVSLEVTGPRGEQVRAEMLVSGGTVYLETAHACGLHLVAPEVRDPLAESTVGVGELLRAAAELAPQSVVAGLGGSATNDGGAGMLAALGYRFTDAAGRPIAVESGPGPLLALSQVVSSSSFGLRGDLVAATDVDSPLLGPLGASLMFSRQKGATDAAAGELEACLRRLAEVAGRDLPGVAGAELVPGAGSAGGLGYGLLVLGGRVESGSDLVLASVRFSERLVGADLVLTGEGSFDDQSLHGKVASGVARRARDWGVPCSVLAGRVSVTATPSLLEAEGITSTHATVDEAGSLEASLAEPARYLAQLAERVAFTGCWRGGGTVAGTEKTATARGEGGRGFRP